MNKTFTMRHPKIKVPRLFEAAKNEIRKYVKRERRRDLPEGVDFWDFDCTYGPTEADAKEVHLSEIAKHIDEAEAQGLESFFVSVWAKEGHRTKKVAEIDDDVEDEEV